VRPSDFVDKLIRHSTRHDVSQLQHTIRKKAPIGKRQLIVSDEVSLSRKSDGHKTSQPPNESTFAMPLTVFCKSVAHGWLEVAKYDDRSLIDAIPAPPYTGLCYLSAKADAKTGSKRR
jgi:hypothetical protein